MSIGAERAELIVADTDAWRAWLHENHANSAGVWLVLAKKNTVGPTQLTYDQALDEALCFGWIDGQRGTRDQATFRQRYTPRRVRSPWSLRNVGIIERLTADGRIHPAGVAEVDRAKADGRWEVAYAGQATAVVPDDLAVALAANPTASAIFERLNAANRFAIIYRVNVPKRAENRARRIDELVAMLARGETIHPQVSLRG